ncbi:MAG: choice-of-anchor I family protein, partial [Cytophagales bacterium]
MKKVLFSVIYLLIGISTFAQIRLTTVTGSTSIGFNTEGGVAEITAYDKITKQLYVINGNTNEVIVYDFSNPNTVPLTSITSISITGSGSINSIACKNGLLALIYENATSRQLNGFLQLITTTGNTLIGSPISVGAQPDMVTFTPNGQKILVANEGEANKEFTIDPEGSVSILDVTNPFAPTSQQVTLTSLNGTIPHLSTFPNPIPSILIGGMINSELTVTSTNIRTPTSVAQDLEPEYITVSPDGNTAWVTCQENNAVVIINVNSATLTTIIGLGFKNHNTAGNGLDIGGQQNTAAINIRTWPIRGIYMPDAITVETIGGIPYLFTANEGDGRDYRQSGSGQGTAGNRTFRDERDMDLSMVTRLNSPLVNTLGATNLATLTASGLRFHAGLGILNPASAPYLANTVVGGNVNIGNTYNEIYVYGTRSFSIWNGLTGALVWDSGDQIERNVLNALPQNFNTNHNGGDNNPRRRSASKGPEPEAIVTGTIGDSLYAFVGLERIGGVMVFNVTNPNAPYFRQYINTRNFALAPSAANSLTGNDLGPEGLTIIKSDESADGKNYLVVSNEISGTLRVFRLDYSKSITRNNLMPFTIASQGTESDFQALSISGNGFTSPLFVSSTGDFRTSLIPDGSFAVGTLVTFLGNSFNTVVYVKYLGSDALQNSMISFVDASSMSATGINVMGSKFATTTPGVSAYTLQVLHASDFEAGLAAMDNAPKFAAIWDKFNGEYANTLRVSGGDNFLPSPFFNAAADGALRTTFANINNGMLGGTNGGNYREGIGRGDITFMNLLDLHASAIGNHEFDAGTGTFSEMISVAFNDAVAPTQVRWAGTRFPYLSSNLDFSLDANLSGLYTNEIRPSLTYKIGPTPAEILALTSNQRRKIAPATVVTIGGETIGIVGATTQIVQKISSTGAVSVIGTNVDDMPLLATQVQAQVDRLRAMGINKIVLLAHLQQISNEIALAPLLSGVDIIVAAGSHTLLADANDALEGDTKSPVGDYPIVSTDKDGGKTLIVSTESEYKYVGRLVIDFDANGNILPASNNTTISGAWKATDLGMINAMVNTVTAFSGTNRAYLTKGIIEGINSVAGFYANAITLSGLNNTFIGIGIRGIINSQDGNVFGKTQVFMEGRREGVRQQETNLGNVTSDANLWHARNLGFNVQVSLKNGGGIRASLGVISAVGSNFVNLPPLAVPSAGKLAGEISQLDIANALRFNNGLTCVTVTAAQLLQVMNHSVAASTATATPGQFPQIGGMRFSYDIAQPVGSKVRSLAIVDSVGNVIDVIANNGVVVGNSARTIGMVTLNFMVNGGDNYPFPAFNTANPALFNRMNVYTIPGDAPTLAFIDRGSEQQGFARYLQAAYPRTSAGYNIADTQAPLDLRTQNLSARSESIIPNFSMPIATFAGFVNETVALSPVSISGMMLADVIRVMAPANVSIDGMSMKTVSGMGGLVSISAMLPASAGTSTFVITLASASLTKTFTHVAFASNPPVNPSITFNGFNMTVDGLNVDLSALFTSNSSGTKTFAVSGTAAVLVGQSTLSAVSAGTVTITGMVSSTTGFNAGMANAIVNVI